jgi:hypothetical protein
LTPRRPSSLSDYRPLAAERSRSRWRPASLRCVRAHFASESTRHGYRDSHLPGTASFGSDRRGSISCNQPSRLQIGCKARVSSGNATIRQPRGFSPNYRCLNGANHRKEVVARSIRLGGIGERLEGVVLSVRWDIGLGVSALQRFLLRRGDGECTSCPSLS